MHRVYTVSCISKFHQIVIKNKLFFVKLKNSARIPTPDATTSNTNEKESRFNLAPSDMINEDMTSMANITTATLATGVALIPANLPDLPNQNVTLFLSPIKESDSNSAHSTLQAGTPATNALADWRNST